MKEGMALSDPGSVGVDPGLLRDYDAQMRKAVRGGLMAGCASAILRQGQLVQGAGYGLADLDTKVPFRADTICRVYCMTKPYVLLVFMSLVEEGRAKLDDPVAKYLPAFRDVRVVGSDGALVRPKRSVTLEHLALHMSGIGYSAGFGAPPENDSQKSYAALVESVASGKVRSLKDFVGRLAKLPLRFHPGEDYEYGFSIDVLAHVVEVISGRSIEHCMQERVFKPLGMQDTGFAVEQSNLCRFAACYGTAQIWGNLYGHIPGKVPVTTRPGLVRIDGDSAKESAWCKGRECQIRAGGGWMAQNQGGLVSTVDDTVRFLRMLIDYGVSGNGVRLLKRETLLRMELPSPLGAAIGRDICIFGNIGGYVSGGSEFGQGGHASTFWSLDRKDAVAVVWFAQHLDFWSWDAEVVDPEKADIWKMMHKAVHTGKGQGLKRERSCMEAGG
ncbi:unnamed protein product [Polarella glacialis]|uniref:Beta-lactamase-related domain-containing protein n=1 Tax=Polarella glacialis TaxID=89957 RepID=A0A813M3A0_POLGL|nr:unnamed protein product [Polarella glacialis]